MTTIEFISRKRLLEMPVDKLKDYLARLQKSPNPDALLIKRVKRIIIHKSVPVSQL